MNTPDPFEKRLSEIPMRAVPAFLRNEILREVLDPGDRKAAIQPHERGALALLRQCLWPHPTAWGALAAAWVVIVVLNISSGVTSISLARRSVPVPPSPELLSFLREQRALLQSLLAEPTSALPPVERKPSAHWLRRERVPSVA